MTQPDISNCPRCGFEYDTARDALPPAVQQTNACAYCRMNGYLIYSGRRVLQHPTEQYPTWQPE